MFIMNMINFPFKNWFIVKKLSKTTILRSEHFQLSHFTYKISVIWFPIKIHDNLDESLKNYNQ